MKKTSSELIRLAVEKERLVISAAERKRIVRLLQDLGRGFGFAGQVQHQQAVMEAIRTIERNC